MTRLIDLYAEIYNKSNLEKQIIGDTFKERRKKALDIVEEVLKDAKEIDDLRKIMIADKSIYKSNPTPDDFRRSHAYGNNQPKTLVSYMRKLVKQSPKEQAKTTQPKSQPNGQPKAQPKAQLKAQPKAQPTKKTM